jgi:hypothetical protein
MHYRLAKEKATNRTRTDFRKPLGNSVNLFSTSLSKPSPTLRLVMVSPDTRR